MTNRITRLAFLMLAVVLVLTLVLMSGCGEEESGILTIYHAGSLGVPMDTMKTEFQAKYPNVEVLLESGGSAAMINKSITREQAGETPPDIIASADYTLIPSRLYELGYADWTIVFAKNEVVLCYRDGAPFADDIESGSRMWYDVLRNETVSWGHSDPDDDPCGYRSLMVLQLAQMFYFDDAATFGNTPDPNADGLYDACVPGTEQERGRVSEGNQVVRSKSVDLIALLQSGDLDYAFEYSSVAVQYGLGYIKLDDAINLSQAGTMGSTGMTYADFYKKAVVEIQTAPGEYSPMEGQAVVYGITIMNNAPAPDLAAKFMEFLLSETGKQVFEVENGQPFISPPKCDYLDNLPSSLSGLVVEM
jgi:molybdate/tungstate transport system substrate-binding protein